MRGLPLAARIVLAVVAGSYAATTAAAPKYDITPIGFYDVEHTSLHNYSDTAAEQLNELGQVIGNSGRYLGRELGFSLGQTAWLFDGTSTINIGLTDSEHTAGNGYRVSLPRQLSEAGQVIGYSNWYNGWGDGKDHLGRTAWIYDGDETIVIGLTGPEHTGSGGWKYSFPGQLNEAGQVIGEADRFNGGNIKLGVTAWLYNGTATINIGLTGAEHTRTDGFKRSIAQHLTDAGQVVGYSIRYNANVQLGQTAWYYNGSSTVPIGFTGMGFTRGSGWKYSASDFVSDSGKVLGYSERYTNQGDFGRAAWLFDGANTIELGLLDAEHTAFGGTKYSSARALNESGQATGYSRRYGDDGEDLGGSAWIYNGTNTTKIGLTDAEHTRNDGFKHSAGYAINETGQVLGVSERYDGTREYRGRTAWLYDGANIIPLGLTDAAHLGANTYRYSFAESINEAGQVIGYSDRYNGGATRLGQSAWLYDGTASINLGLTGPQFFRPDGHHFSKATQLNDAGWVIGYSHQFDGINDNGSMAWVYHPGLRQTIPLQPVQTTEGHVDSGAEYLGDDGIVLGSYEVYDAFNTGMGVRAFYYSPADGLHDLGELVDGDLSAIGWQYLADAFEANSHGQIVGHGLLNAREGQMAFLLRPAVPLTGDFNSDGRVDTADYVVWRKTDGALPGYNVWRANFGHRSADAALSNAPIPEPFSALLLLLAAAAALSCPRFGLGPALSREPDL